MMWDILTNDEKNQAILKILISITKVDEKINENEFAYLVYFCKNVGLDPNLITKFAADNRNLNEIMPVNEQDRMNVLYHALFTMNADNAVDGKEEQMMFLLAFKLGFSESMTRDFINLMKSHTIDNIPMNGMMDIIRKYNS
jgi:hypothetical protein